MTLCVLGDFAWDVIIRPDGQLRRGGDVFGDVTLMPGGSAANVAVWAQRLGTPTYFIGKVGDDALGQLARQNLTDEDVEFTLVATKSRQTGAIAVLLDEAGERSMVSGFGADFYLEPSDIPLKVLAVVSHLHLTGWSLFHDPPRSAALLAAKVARQHGATISLDPVSFQVLAEQGVNKFLEITVPLGVSLLFPNREEAEVLTAESDLEGMVAALQGTYRGASVVLKLGADGALVCVAGATPVLVPASVVEAVDATGAGDSLAGATLARYLAGDDLVAAVRTATQVAAWKVNNIGARPNPPQQKLVIWKSD